MPEQNQERGTLVVVGQGYVGLPLAVRAVEVGWNVVGFEPDELRAKRLQAGESYVEDITSEQLAAALETGRYHPTPGYEQCQGFDVAVITVPTPLREGAPDLSYIEDAGRGARAATCGRARRWSWSRRPTRAPPRSWSRPILEEGSGLTRRRGLPPRLQPRAHRPGQPDVDASSTRPKVVSGIDAASLERGAGLLRHARRARPCRCPRPKEAELTKLLENTFRHVNIALVNELAMFAARPRHRRLGGDRRRVDQAVRVHAVHARPRRRRALPADRPVATCRGGCSSRSASTFRFVELANDVNDHMPDYVVRRLMRRRSTSRRKPVNGARILLLGLAYKQNTGDARESPAAARRRSCSVDLGAEVRAVRPARRAPR